MRVSHRRGKGDGSSVTRWLNGWGVFFIFVYISIKTSRSHKEKYILFICLASPIITQTNNNYTTISVQPQSETVKKLMSSFIAKIQ